MKSKNIVSDRIFLSSLSLTPPPLKPAIAYIFTLSFFLSCANSPHSHEKHIENDASSDAHKAHSNYGRLLFQIRAGVVGSDALHVLGYVKATVCRHVSRVESFSLARFYFAPGSPKVVKVKGLLGYCSTQPRQANGDVSKLGCKLAKLELEQTSDPVVLHGLSWLKETKSEDKAVELSRRRALSARKWLHEKGAVSLVDEVCVHEPHSTFGEINYSADGSPLGAFLTRKGESRPIVQQTTGPPLSAAAYRRFVRLLEKTDASEPSLNAHALRVSVAYRPLNLSTPDTANSSSSAGTFRHFLRWMEPFRESSPSLEALQSWVNQLFAHDCQSSALGSQLGFRTLWIGPGLQGSQSR